MFEDKEVTEKELTFLSKYTGNSDLKALKEHVQKLKQDLVDKKIHVYKCIKSNRFLYSRMAKHNNYPKVTDAINSHYKSGSPFKVADVGCCFGTDTRKLILDGCHLNDVYAIDVHDEYWNIGYDLYCDKDKLKVNVLFTDCARQDLLVDHPDLKNKFNVIYTGAVLHVFAEDEVVLFLQNIYDMMVPGGIYFGSCGVADTPGITTVSTPVKKDKMRYIHSSESLKELLEKIGFQEVDIQVSLGSEEKNTDLIPELRIRRMVMYYGKKM